MNLPRTIRVLATLATGVLVGMPRGYTQELRVELKPTMLTNEAEVGDPSGLIDEQREIIGPPAGKPKTTWELNSKYWKQFPFSAHLDLGEEKNLSSLWIYDTNGTGDVVISAGKPGQWTEVATYDCGTYLAWAEVELDVTTRYLRITRKTPGANFSEIAVYEYSDEAFQALQQRKAEEARREAQRQAELRRAREEALRRPLVEMVPYGTLSLVDQIDCSADGAEHGFSEAPAGASKVETILGRKARVLPPTKEEAAYFSYRIGRMKLLRPGGVYVLAVEYPEDATRSMVVINTGNETSRGFHTGATLGDAFHAKYVNNLPESIDVPLSGRWETWSLLFRLHDRFPEKGLVRGPKPRPLGPEDGFDVLPYYEYSGSKGYKGLGNQRRARPLTRDDAYTHITWIESANADITDPDTYEDFRKMLDLTVVRLRSQARFAGIWVRPRGQMPVSFSEKALARFSAEAADRQPVTRESLKTDAELYARYVDWWGVKRREFLCAMRDYLRSQGVGDAMVLFTGCPSEPGVAFHCWDPRMVTDCPELWRPILQQPEHAAGDRGPIVPISVEEVVRGDLYLEALTSPGLNWGNWEVHHSRPADDPQHYKQTEGILLTHAFNRNYTVASPQTLDAYRAPAGLAIVRHYALNENMMFDKSDKEILAYFVADVERAGPYCMMAEAHAVAHGDPTMIGYLVGNNFGRGFPQYVRNFNANYLALPALPSTVVAEGAADPQVVVRRIDTPQHGTWIAVVNTSLHAKRNVAVRLPQGKATDAVTGQDIQVAAGKTNLDLYPCQLRTFRVR